MRHINDTLDLLPGGIPSSPYIYPYCLWTSTAKEHKLKTAVTTPDERFEFTVGNSTSLRRFQLTSCEARI